MSGRKMKGAGSMAKRVLDSYLVFSPEGGAEPVIPHLFVRGRDPLVVVVGSNSSGKSVFRRLLEGDYREKKVECISISMYGRCQGSFGGAKSFIYGDEGWNATGVNSAHTVLNGINTCRGRGSAHVMSWDEPDIGMSDEGAAAMGIAIREFAQDPPKHTKGIFIITHSRHLAAQLVPVRPHYLYCGAGRGAAPPTLGEWASREVVPADLRTLADEGHAMFKRIQTFLKG
jgi:hypothetical protein